MDVRFTVRIHAWMGRSFPRPGSGVLAGSLQPGIDPGCSLRNVEHSGSSSGAGQPPAEWILLADSSLAAFLRMLADVPDPDTVAASIARGVLAAFRPTVVAIGFIRVDQQVLVTAGLALANPRSERTSRRCRWTLTSPPPSVTDRTRS